MTGVTVTITTYKRPELLECCIKSVFKNTTRPIEIVVSDNAYSSESIESVRRCEPPDGIVVRHSANPGDPTPSGNARSAFLAASHERIAHMHDDDFFMPGGIDALVKEWDSRQGDVDAVYGRHYHTHPSGEIDYELTSRLDEQFKMNSGFGAQRSNLWAALAQQFPNTGMMFRKSIALRVGYPREDEVGRDPLDLHFGIRYAFASQRPFVLIDFFVSANRLSEVSILRCAHAERTFDGHLGYAIIDRIVPSNEFEETAKRIRLANLAPRATTGYLKVGKTREAAKVFFSNYWMMEKTFFAKMGLLSLIFADMIGLKIIDRYGVNVWRFYDYIYKPNN